MKYLKQYRIPSLSGHKDGILCWRIESLKIIDIGFGNTRINNNFPFLAKFWKVKSSNRLRDSFYRKLGFMGSAAGHSPHSCSVKFDESVGGFGWASNVLSNLPQSALWPRYCFTSIKLNGGEAFPCLISINIQSHALIRCSSIWETLPQKSNFFWIIKGNCFIINPFFHEYILGISLICLPSFQTEIDLMS